MNLVSVKTVLAHDGWLRRSYWRDVPIEESFTVFRESERIADNALRRCARQGLTVGSMCRVGRRRTVIECGSSMSSGGGER